MTAGGWFGSWFGGGSGSGTTLQPGAISAGEVIEAARKQHPAFSEAAIPLPVALVLLTNLYEELQQEGLALDPNVSATELAHVPLGPWDPTIPVPANAAIVGGSVYFPDDQHAAPVPLDIVAYADRFSRTSRFTAYEENQQLILVGLETDWTGVDHLIVRYLASPIPLTAATDTMYLPLSARPVLQRGLAHHFALRCLGLGIGNVDVPSFEKMLQHAHDAWLATMGRAGRPRPMQIQDVT